MRRGHALLAGIVSFVMTFASLWIARFGLTVTVGDLYAWSMFLLGILVGILCVAAWRWE